MWRRRNPVFYRMYARLVYANENLLLRWTADDHVSIFNKITYNQEYKFLGETGDNAGGFNRVDNAEFVTGNPISHVVSVYPYQASTKITEDEVLTLTIPAEQHHAENTFGLGANTMVSVSEDNVLQYKNVGGYLRLSLYGEGVSVSSITLRGNHGERLAGKASVTMAPDGEPVIETISDATDEISLLCDTPVTLAATAEESVQFWFVLPPVTFNEGFTITVNRTKGGAFEKSTSKRIVIERNKLSKMSPMEVEAPQPSDVIYYTSSDEQVVAPNPGADFGAEILSNEYVDGRGVITFDGDVTRIGDHAFYGCTSLTGISIPENVTSIGDSAFQGSTGLLRISFPENVSSIGSYAFRGCYSLTLYVFESPVPPATTSDTFSIEYAGNPQPPSNFDYRILVPEAAVDRYREEWKENAERIYEQTNHLASSFLPLTAQDLTIQLSEHIVYSYSLLDLLTIQDNLRRDLLDHGSWVIGDRANGIPYNLSAYQYYNISFRYSYDIPSELRRLISFEVIDEDIRFSFDYTSQIEFHGTVVIPVTLSIYSLFGVTSVSFNIVIMGIQN